MTTFIRKETISRLLKDVKNIIKNPLTENDIYYIGGAAGRRFQVLG